MAKKRIVALLTALIMIISFSQLSYAFVGPIMENGDKINRLGDHYILDDGILNINKIGVFVKTSGTAITYSAGTTAVYKKAGTDFYTTIMSSGTCARECYESKTTSSGWGGTTTCIKWSYTCTDCSGVDHITIDTVIYNLFQHKICRSAYGLGNDFFQTSQQPTMDVNINFPLKAGDVLMVHDLPRDGLSIKNDMIDIAYSTELNSVKKDVCFDNVGKVSDTYEFDRNTAQDITIDNPTPIKSVKMIYLKETVPGGLSVSDRIRVYKDTIINENNKLNFGAGNTASWSGCDANKCDSAGLLEPHVIKLPSNWAERIDYGFNSIHIHTAAINPGKFKLCAILGCDYDAAELCNEEDDNCDGIIDGEFADYDLCECTDGTTKPCSTDKGICHVGVNTCTDGEWGDCSTIEPEDYIELCGNGDDDDCDGVADYNDEEDCACPDLDNDGYSEVGDEWPICGEVDCDDSNPLASPELEEVCDGFDNDCDGEDDETCTPKLDQAESTTGTCPADQCYYYDGYIGMCVKDGNYTMDYYCDNGNWTTRTALIAAQLVQLAGSSDYTLFCGNPEEAVNDLQYFILTAKYNATRYVYGQSAGIGLPPDCTIECPDMFPSCPCVNNICVLSYEGGDKVAFGVSTNLPLNTSESQDLSFLRLFEESQQTFSSDGHYDYCDGAMRSQEDRYLGCDRNNVITGESTTLWYNPKRGSVIYSQEDITIGESSFTSSLVEFLKDPLAGMREIIFPDDVLSEEFIDTAVFDKLYISKIGNIDKKVIRGFVNEDIGRMAISYENIYTNICAITDSVLEKIYYGGGIRCGLEFVDAKPVFYVESEEPAVFRELWPDMTTKIRLEGGAGSFGEADMIDDFNAVQAVWQGEYGLPVDFTAVLKDGIDSSDIFQYGWDFGDETISDQATPRHYYSKLGEYDVSLRVFDKSLREDTFTKTVNVAGFDNGHDCNIDGQCNSGFCAPGSPYGTCQESTCSDGYKGLEETDVDCGGVCVAEGKLCQAGQMCEQGSDCITEECADGKCSAPLMTCEVKQACDPGESLIFKMSDTTNAHAELFSQNNYGYSVCCAIDKDTIGNDCSSSNAGVALKLSSETNAHVSQWTVAGYENEACISALNSRVSCSYANSCEDIGECVASISGILNAHVGDCTAYPLKVCCGFGIFEASVCGNSVLEEGEECEDGNTEPGDGCSPECTTECPDGDIDGTEECDDGNEIDDDRCSNECKINYRYAFLTQGVYNGNFGGVEGADDKCQEEADAAGLPGEYTAWVSSVTDSASSRLGTDNALPYKLPDNTTIVASDYGNLTDGSIDAPINKDASGDDVDLTQLSTNLVWTGTKTDGNYTSKDCTSWTSGAATALGDVGNPANTDSSWTLGTTTRTCDATYHLYCFEQ